MKNYKNILLTTDFSAHSEAAGERAVDLSRRYEASLTLFHVVEVDAPQVVPLDWSMTMQNEELTSYWIDTSIKKLAEFAKQIDAEDAKQIVISGFFSPKRDILKYAEDHGIDLIIMGTHGKRGLDVLLGSTASGVMHRSLCDVLTVRI